MLGVTPLEPSQCSASYGTNNNACEIDITGINKSVFKDGVEHKECEAPAEKCTDTREGAAVDHSCAALIGGGVAFGLMNKRCPALDTANACCFVLRLAGRAKHTTPNVK